MVPLPDGPGAARYTQQTCRMTDLSILRRPNFLRERSPSNTSSPHQGESHLDQVFGDVKNSGDGHAADGEPDFAIFGSGAAAQRPAARPKLVTPHHHALAQRFGLFDRFFVNSEASPDGHNWATAAFSTDYVDKGFRWEYSDRGRTYDWEGFNRLAGL